MTATTDCLATVRAALAKHREPREGAFAIGGLIALGNAAPSIAALADECERLRGAGATEDLLLGRVAELTQVRDELTAKHDTRGRLLSGQAARIATLEAELAAARALEAERDQLRNAILHLSMAVDTDAVKAESVAEGWRLLAVATLAEVRKLAAARAVTASVKEALHDYLAAFNNAGDTVEAGKILHAAIARDKAAAVEAAVGDFIDGHAARIAGNDWSLMDADDQCSVAAQVHDVLNHLRGDESGAVIDGRAPRAATVGELLGSHRIVEWFVAPDWHQARIRQSGNGMVRGAEMRWRHHRASSWSSWGQPWGDPAQHMDKPARLVPADQADTDPASRGPIGVP